MTLDKFLEDFRDQFEDTPAEQITASTDFKNLDEWCSMVSLCVVAFIDSDYGVNISAVDIKTSDTVEDLFKIVQSKAK